MVLRKKLLVPGIVKLMVSQVGSNIYKATDFPVIIILSALIDSLFPHMFAALLVGVIITNCK